jgi:4-amino-4-deoxychorismate lyase
MYWNNGKLIENNIITLDIYNPAFLYGATVFTTMRVYENSLEHPLTNWKAHRDRLNNSIKKFQWQTPDWDQIKQGCEILLKFFPVLRITVFPDGKELIIGRNLPQDLSQNQQNGVIGWLADPHYQRCLNGDKTGNYLGPWLALQQAQKLGAKEAILRDSDGNWLETSTGNLWGYRDGIWFTPSLTSGILPGITRNMMIEKATFPIQENIWNPQFVKTLKVIAYSNCVVEFIFFSSIINCNKK